MRRRRRRALVCPKCGWDGTSEGDHDWCFRHLEDVATERRVVGFNADGVLEVESEERIQFDDPGANQRIQCGNCLAEFSVPEDVNVNFI